MAVAQDGAKFGRLGAFRTQLGEAAQGLSLSAAQSFQYDTNLVRTSSDLETSVIYNTPDATDFVSQTSVNATYQWDGKRTRVSVGGDIGYAQYLEFDQFSGLVAGVDGNASWQFSERCQTGVDGRIERRLANFEDLNQSDANFQDELNGDLEVGCFILDRVRISGGVFGASTRNKERTAEFADIDDIGFRLMLALVSAKKNEIGLRYRSVQTDRPNDPTSETIKNQRIEVYGLLRLGHKLQMEAAVGGETESRDTGSDTDRSSARFDVRYAPTSRLSTRIGYDRGILDSQDLVGTTRETDQLQADLNWRVATRISTGVYANHVDDTLNGGTGSLLTGVNESTIQAGAYIEHTVFNLATLRWNLGYAERDSDLPARDYDSVHGGVTIGLGF